MFDVFQDTQESYTGLDDRTVHPWDVQFLQEQCQRSSMISWYLRALWTTLMQAVLIQPLTQAPSATVGACLQLQFQKLAGFLLVLHHICQPPAGVVKCSTASQMALGGQMTPPNVTEGKITAHTSYFRQVLCDDKNCIRDMMLLFVGYKEGLMSSDTDTNAMHIFTWSDEKHSKEHSSSHCRSFLGDFVLTV